MQELLEKKHVGIVAAYSIDGDISWKGEYGFRNQETKEAFTSTTLTRVASLAKPMTAIAIMQLVEKGTLNLDAPITDYIDFPTKSKTSITTRHLLAHTSGIDGYASPKEAQNKINYPTLTDALNIFKHRDLLFEPGTQFKYTSYGYVVLGVLIEQISGLSYADYMKTNVWDKAGMTNTTVEVQGMNFENRTQLYHKKRKKAKRAEQNDLSNRVPAGGFSTTLEDILSFGQAIIDKTLISEDVFEEMMNISYQPEKGNPYGLGFQLYGSKGTESVLIGHGGGQTGTSSQIFIDRSRNIVSVCISNTSGTDNDIILMALELYLKARNGTDEK
jgi:CubicO group peptidase (beta-lactamase class C family)